jgi:hypothetical protein
VQYRNGLPADFNIRGPIWGQRGCFFPQVRDSVSYALTQILIPYGSKFLAQERLEGVAAPLVLGNQALDFPGYCLSRQEIVIASLDDSPV